MFLLLRRICGVFFSLGKPIRTGVSVNCGQDSSSFAITYLLTMYPNYIVILYVAS